jgi:hypothetical protein
MKYEEVTDVNRGVFSDKGTYLGYIYKYELKLRAKVKKQYAEFTTTYISRLSPMELVQSHKERLAATIGCKDAETLVLLDHNILSITNKIYGA